MNIPILNRVHTDNMTCNSASICHEEPHSQSSEEAFFECVQSIARKILDLDEKMETGSVKNVEISFKMKILICWKLGPI